MKEIIARWKAETPIFFKNLIVFGITLAGVGGALLAAEKTVPNFHLPALMYQASQWMIVAGLVCSAVSKTTKKDVPNA
jgi:hypothetical protein